MCDLFGEDEKKFSKVIEVASNIAEKFCFHKIFTPVIEYSELFERNLGDDSEVVSKEIYKFLDRGNDSIALRPEFTAGVVRGVIENPELRKLSPIKLFTFGQLFRENQIPVLKSKDINNEEAVDFMKGVSANMIVSSYNNQILRYRTCKKFKYGAIGIHNSYLPDFGGLDAAFEGLYHGVKETGVTAHLIDRGIDTGRIIYQEKIAIEPGDSVFSLNIRQWLWGARLIPQILDLFRKGSVDSEEQDRNEAKYPYESFPKREKVRELMKNGKRCIRLRDIFVINPYLLELFPVKKSR